MLVIDVSAATFHHIEPITRTAGMAVARTLLAARVPLRVLLLGGQPVLLAPTSPNDLLPLLTHRSLQRAEPAANLRFASQVLHQLPAQAAILLLTHTFFCADEPPPPLRDLRALFVQYPQNPDARPPPPAPAPAGRPCITMGAGWSRPWAD